MTENFKPETQEQVLELVNWAAADGHAFNVSGTGTKKTYGRSLDAVNGLSLSAFSGIALYEPEELVMAMGAGTPMADIHAALQEKNQHLAFEPMDLGPLLGESPDGGTIGDITSAAFSPTVGVPIAMGYVAAEHAADGTAVTIGDAARPARITALPFVPHKYKR